MINYFLMGPGHFEYYKILDLLEIVYFSYTPDTNLPKERLYFISYCQAGVIPRHLALLMLLGLESSLHLERVTVLASHLTFMSPLQPGNWRGANFSLVKVGVQSPD